MLHREVYDRAADLDCFVVARQQWGALLHEHQSAKLALVVFEKELAIGELDLGVAAGDGDIVDAKITFVAAT